MGERIGLIADIHGNSPALCAVLEEIRQVGCSRLFVLGDIINGLDPSGCIDLLQSWPGQVSLKGNAEFYLLTPALEEFPLRAEPVYEEVIRLVHWWRARLSADHWAWLESLPDLFVRNGACFVHDSPLDRRFPERRCVPGIAAQYQELCYHSRGVTADLGEEEARPLLAWMGAEGLSHLFCGHTHQPFCRTINGACLCNVGSVGMPLDGDPRAAWVVLNAGADGALEITPCRTPYPIDQTLEIIERTPDYPSFTRPGVREAYGRMLASGVHWRAYVP
jgi:predicted phosphodiesterase